MTLALNSRDGLTPASRLRRFGCRYRRANVARPIRRIMLARRGHPGRRLALGLVRRKHAAGDHVERKPRAPCDRRGIGAGARLASAGSLCQSESTPDSVGLDEPGAKRRSRQHHQPRRSRLHGDPFAKERSALHDSERGNETGCMPTSARPGHCCSLSILNGSQPLRHRGRRASPSRSSWRRTIPGHERLSGIASASRPDRFDVATSPCPQQRGPVLNGPGYIQHTIAPARSSAALLAPRLRRGKRCHPGIHQVLAKD